MPVIVNLDVVLAQRILRSNELAERIGITPQNSPVLKSVRAKAMRFSTLETLCEILEFQPGDILEFRPQAAAERGRKASSNEEH